MGLIIQKEKHTEKREPYWVTYILGRIARKKNFLGCFTGTTGSGKSLSGITLCDLVDKTFIPNLEKRVVFSMLELMELLNDKENPLKNGEAVLWEEGGTSVSSRDWQSLSNKLINFLLQTFRHRRIVLILNVPYIDFIDSNTRKLFHASFETTKIDYKLNKCFVKPRILQYNSRSKKTYEKMLRIHTPEGVVPLRLWGIPKPAKWICDSYERLKTNFTTNLNEDIMSQLKAEQRGDKKPLTKLQTQAKDLMDEYKDTSKVAEIMGVTERNVRFHFERIRNKGFDVEENTGKGGKTAL